MSVIYSATLKDARMNAVVTAIGASGKLEIGTSSLSGSTGVLAVIPLAATPGTVAGGVLTFAMPQSDNSADAGGTAAKAQIRTGANADVVTGLTVGVGGGFDVNLNSTTISQTQTVTINSATITHG